LKNVPMADQQLLTQQIKIAFEDIGKITSIKPLIYEEFQDSHTFGTKKLSQNRKICPKNVTFRKLKERDDTEIQAENENATYETLNNIIIVISEEEDLIEDSKILMDNATLTELLEGEANTKERYLLPIANNM
ncbi:20950_t:CDS:2, partial [Gigaspora margarita]